MLRASSRSIKSPSGKLLQRQSFKRHSSDHHEPLGPEQDLLKSYLVTPVLLTIGGIGLYKWNESYKKSHKGEGLISILGESYNADTLINTYKKYQDVITDEKKLYKLISFNPRRDKDHYALHIDGVPGKYFPYNAASNFSASVDFDNLEERRQPFNSFK